MKAAEKHPVALTVESMDAAFARGDIEALMAFYDGDAALVADPSGEIVRGKDGIRALFEKVLASGGTASQQRTHVIETDGIALFLSHWTYAGTDANGEGFSWQLTATSVFRRDVDGQWRALIDNSFGPAVLEH